MARNEAERVHTMVGAMTQMQELDIAALETANNAG